MTNPTLLPRLIRYKLAPFYLGMDRNRFNTEVRPHLIEIPIGKQGIAYDRLDLDAWADQYKSRNGRLSNPTGERLWDAQKRPVSTNAERLGTSIKKSEVAAFAKALAQATLKKQKPI